ncbi:MAG TPA: DUF2318 domain-containing protein, partial [Blastocatellia bacterium]
SANTGVVSPPEQVFQQGADARIPLSKVNDGKLHFFAYNAASGPVRFLTIKLASGKLGVAFDACQICGSKGYFQDGPQVICRNCTAAINPSSIGQSGGCNPIEIRSTVEGDNIVVSASDLDGGSAYFPSSGQK